ncbi:MAG TPA: discoidin domain-containing protein [Pirellulales bacterium]|nr:discoidin domain-containing protein [Pirellulales bacterium]
MTFVVASQAYGLGGIYGPEELKFRAGAIGGQSPVGGYWVNWEDVFFYAGDAQAFNQFIDAYGGFKRCKLEVVIHRGPKQAAAPWKELDVAADWSLYVWNTGANFLPKIQRNEAGEAPSEPVDLEPIGEPAPTRVDLWISQRLKLADLRVPMALNVTAAKDAAQDGEIQKFVAARALAAGPMESASQAQTDVFRLMVELSDGSRLKGEAKDLKKLPLQTALGALSVPLEQIAAIESASEHASTTIRFRNGDRLTGTVNAGEWSDLKIETVLGVLTVPTRLVRICEIEPAPRRAAVTVRASGTWQTETPDKAFDADLATDWNSGSYAPAWIEADLGAPARLATLLLLPCQDIAGATTHEIWISDEPIGDDRAKARLIHTFQGETHDRQPLQYDFSNDLHARYVQIRTMQSPTWIAWWDVDIRLAE